MTRIRVVPGAAFALLALSLLMVGCDEDERERTSASPAPGTSPLAAAGGDGRVLTTSRTIAMTRLEQAAAPAKVAATPRAPRTSSPGASGDDSPGVHVSAPRSWTAPWTECIGVHVYIVSLSPGHPERSAASISTTPAGRARVVHPGQWIGEWEVLAITDDWTGMRPGVWLRRDSEVCRARLSGNAEREPPPRPSKRKKKRRAAR